MTVGEPVVGMRRPRSRRSHFEMTDDTDRNLKLYFKSQKLAGHLRRSDEGAVPVEVVVVYDFGRIRAFGVGRVDWPELEPPAWGGCSFSRAEYLFEK